eukprot:scaffold3844_cov105-Cylindrotheca_fusiformis.AAC.3
MSTKGNDDVGRSATNFAIRSTSNQSQYSEISYCSIILGRKTNKHVINMTTPRNQAGSLVMSKPEPKEQSLREEATQGNLLLMEAAYLELVSSIRALYKSNEALEEALKENPHDLDFLQAVKENKYVLLRKREETLRLVVDMKRMGADIDVPDDIQKMSIDVTPKEEEANTATTPLASVEEEVGVYL